MAWWLIAAALAGASTQDMMAPTTAASCQARPMPLPADYVGWTAMKPVSAGAAASDAATLPLATGARVTLRPTASLSFAAAMKHQGTPTQYGGNLAFVAPKAGRYRVALGAAAWIDVVDRKAPAVTLPSVAHGHGPDCSGIRKIVEFDLAPGAYVLQVAGNDGATLGVMVAPVAAAG